MISFYLSLFLGLPFNLYLVNGQEACRTFPQGVLGSCIPIKDCPRLSTLLQQSQLGNTEAVTTLRRSVCSINPPRLCCESVTAEPLSPSHGLSSKCGHGKLADFITDGEDAPNWWPWIVLMMGRWVDSGATEHFCGGTLITDRFALTAAHCMDDRIILKSVRVGELITNTDPDTNGNGKTAPPMQEIPVTNFITHPQHKKPCRRCNDIAILKLARAVKIQEGFTSPICLPLHPEQDMKMSIDDFPGSFAATAGWGTTSANPFDPKIPKHLQQIKIRIDTSQFCKTHTAGHPSGSVICAGAGDGKDTCKGDSGGPLMLTDVFGINWFLVGITSFGPSVCGGQGTQGIFTSVHHHLPWILQNIRS